MMQKQVASACCNYFSARANLRVNYVLSCTQPHEQLLKMYCTLLQAKLEGLFAAAGKALQGSVDISGFDQFLSSMPNRLKPTEQRILITHLHRWTLPDSAAWTFQDILQAGPRDSVIASCLTPLCCSVELCADCIHLNLNHTDCKRTATVISTTAKKIKPQAAACRRPDTVCILHRRSGPSP